MEIQVCGRDDLADGQVRIVRAGGTEIGVIRHAGEFHAFENYCAHQGGPACEGRRIPMIIEHVDADGVYHGQSFDETQMHVVCPWHGYEYRLSDGVHVRDENVRIKKYPVTLREGEVYVTLGSGGNRRCRRSSRGALQPGAGGWDCG